ncbi:MAG: DUF883 family protein [Bacillota bacterium]
MAEASREIINDMSSPGKQTASFGRQALEKASEKLHSQSADWEERYKAVQEKTRQAVDSTTDFVKEHPFSTVLGAAAVGFLAGVITRSRRH